MPEPFWQSALAARRGTGHINIGSAPSGGNVEPCTNPDSIPARLSPASCRTDMTLLARIGGRDYELGSMTLDVPVSVGREHPALWEVGDIEPTLAAALREAADEIENGEG